MTTNQLISTGNYVKNKIRKLNKPLPITEGLFFFPIHHLSHVSILGFNPLREGTFGNEDLSPYPTDTAVESIAFCTKNEGSNSSFGEGGVTCGELSDGDEVVYI